MKAPFAPALAAAALSSCVLASPVPEPAVPAPQRVDPAYEPAPPASPRLPIDPALAKLTSSLDDLLASRWPVRVHVQVDRPVYRPGETVWIRSWHVASRVLAPTGTGSVRYELLDARGEVVATKDRIHLLGGAATNDLVVPANAAGGEYQVRVTGPEGQATRGVTVLGWHAPKLKKQLELAREAYGPGDTVVASVQIARGTGEPLAGARLVGKVVVDGQALEDVAVTTGEDGEASVAFDLPGRIRAGDATLTVLVENGGTTESIARPVPIVLRDVRIEAFPEGGDLVAGLPSRVYFAATRADGRPADVEGFVEDDAGTRVAPFRSVHDGLGRFDLEPQPGRRYHLAITSPVVDTIPLPEAQPSGCVMRAFDDFVSRDAAIRVGVRCSAPSEASVVATLREQRLDVAKLRAGPDGWAVAVLAGSKTPGIARVTVLDADRQPAAERLVFRNPRRRLYIDVTPDAAVHGPRERVGLAITTRDADGNPVPADVAVSVVDDTLLTWADDEQADLVASTLLAELPGTIKEPRFYLGQDPEAPLALDLLMGTRGYRRFDWSQMAAPASAAEVPVRRAKGEAPESLVRAPAPAVPAPAEPEAPAPNATRTRPAGSSGFNGGSFGPKAEGTIAVRAADPIILGSLDHGLVDETIKRNMNQIRYCYQKALTRNRNLSGKLTIKFTIGATGAVTEAGAKRTTLADPSVEECVARMFLRMRFPAPHGGGVIIVSYPFTFSRDGLAVDEVARTPHAPWRRAIEDGDPAVSSAPSPAERWEYARVFPIPEPNPAWGGPRTDFRDTVLWAPAVRTDADGTAKLEFTLGDTIGSFRVLAEGLGGGLPGHGEAMITSRRPFSVAVALPEEVTAADRVLAPITVSNEVDRPLDVDLAATFGGPLAAGEFPRQLSLAGRERRTVWVPLDAVGEGAASVTISASAAGMRDAVVRELRVSPAGFPASAAWSGELAPSLAYRIPVRRAIPGTQHLKLEVLPSPVAMMLRGLDGLLAEPNGCFEQASSANHPNTMVVRYLERRRLGDAAVMARSRRLLERGYRRLAAYEAQSGGFDWFGGPLGHEGLTAYGLVEFTDMKAVYDGVDEKMLARTASWLASRRDGKGGFRHGSNALHTFGDAPPAVIDAYVAWSLVQAGRYQAFEPEVDALLRRGATTRDAYVLALAADAAADAGRLEAGPLGKRLRELQADGHWTGIGPGIAGSTGSELAIETTAIAVAALSKSGAWREANDAAMAWLYAQRGGDGRFGATQATALAMRAIEAYEDKARPPSDGAARVLIDGAPVATLAWKASQVTHALETPDLAAHLTDGDHRVEIVTSGAPVPYTLASSWRTARPDSDPEAPLDLKASLSSASVGMGETVRLTAVITNRSGADVASPLVRLGLPGGLQVEPWQLEALKSSGKVDFVEVRPREVVLYFLGFATGEERTVGLDLTAAIPGTYAGDAPSAYAYYAGDHKRWHEPLRIEIRRP